VKFLSLSHKESFGLPPLEAMACGCRVAGFHSEGGREYMTPKSGWWADMGDYKGCADGLCAAVEVLAMPGPASILHVARVETVEQYSPTRLESALLEFWHREVRGIHLKEQSL
jgi:glycosyltransferase involved in cell wall biosynthesis